MPFNAIEPDERAAHTVNWEPGGILQEAVSKPGGRSWIRKNPAEVRSLATSATGFETASNNRGAVYRLLQFA